MSNQIFSSENNSSEEEEEVIENIRNGGSPHVAGNEDQTSQHGSSESASSGEQQTLVSEQMSVAQAVNPFNANDEGTEENTQHGVPLISTDDGLSQLGAACNVQSSSNGGNSGDQQKVKQQTLTAKPLLLSDKGNHLGTPNCDLMGIPNAQHHSPESVSSQEQQTTATKQITPEEIYADDEDIRMMENIQHGEPVISNDDSLSELGAACNVATSGDQQVERAHIPQWPRFSDRGNPICQPSDDEMEISHFQHGSLERANEELDDAILDPWEIAISESSHTVEEVRYPIEWDEQKNFQLSKEVCDLIMARDLNKIHVTPCKKLRDEVRDPSCYLVDSGYHDNTHSTLSQQPGNSTTSHNNRERSSTDLVQPENSATSHNNRERSSTDLVQPGNSSTSHSNRVRNSTDLVQPENSATNQDNRERNSIELVQGNPTSTLQGTGSTEQFAPALSMPPVQLDSLGAFASESSYEVHDHQSQEACNVLFVHDGYAMFNLTVPKDTTINELITMNQFTEQKRALLGDETVYFLQKGWMNLTIVEEHCTIVIQTDL